MKFCTDILFITMIVTAIFFASFSPLLRAILGSFQVYVYVFFENRLIFSHEIFYKYSCFYSDGHYTKSSFSCHFLLCWEPFWGILGPILVCDVLFLENHSILFHEILYKFLKTLWLLFMDDYRIYSRLQSHYEEIVYFLPLSPQDVHVLL